MNKEFFKPGWVPRTVVDPRDYDLEHPYIRPYVLKVPVMPSAFNLQDKDTPIKDQGSYGSCTAFAGTGIVRYYDKLNNAFKDMSEFFLYYWNRYIDNGNKPNLSDDGATIAATMKALVKYGVCPEEDFPYIAANLKATPSTNADKDALSYTVSKYFTISENSSKIQNIKTSIYSGMPILFGSNVANSIFDVGSDGLEPYDTNYVGGHARVILGWDDMKVIPGTTTLGAFLVRNSWGANWGAQGYSWASYKVFTTQQTDCMGITSANLPNINPTPTPNPDEGVINELNQAIDFLKKSTSTYAKSALPLLRKAVTDLGGTPN